MSIPPPPSSPQARPFPSVSQPPPPHPNQSPPPPAQSRPPHPNQPPPPYAARNAPVPPFEPTSVNNPAGQFTHSQQALPGHDLAFRFDGGVLTFWGTFLLAVAVTVLTFTIAYPFAVVLFQRWRAKHTIIGGRRLEFTGSALELWARWLLWDVLIFLTFGIYLLWVVPRITRWKVEHLRFASTDPSTIDLTGNSGYSSVPMP